ncbi:FeoA family protein [Polynucleobacter paneuropaeus]|uniref:FeoA family protein n=1 Tax=Polynucleobacter paneuropaeus TaxID=2527775 RepID=UPI001BFEBE17|nr:FeoA family protein [Polynucleobacter paneuropaeus]MBT8622237.1 ferrous iron transport protein A [Polynucleobacter paneuropaeus]
MFLDQASLDTLFRIKGVLASETSPEVKGQLEDIGFLIGEQVTVLRKGLFGKGPILVRVGSSTFALRENEAKLIQLEAIAS